MFRIPRQVLFYYTIVLGGIALNCTLAIISEYLRFTCSSVHLSTLRLFNNVLDYTESVCINLRDIRVSGELLVIAGKG